MWNSAPWKRDLLNDVRVLERWLAKPLSERRSAVFEKKVFVSAFCMRKLIEARRLSSSFAGRTVRARLFPPTGLPITRLNNHRFDQQYALGNPVDASLSAARLLDLVVHSFTFVECLGEADELTGFMIASDRSRAAGLYQIAMSDYLALMRIAGNDDPEMTTYTLSEKHGDYDVWNGPKPKRR